MQIQLVQCSQQTFCKLCLLYAVVLSPLLHQVWWFKQVMCIICSHPSFKPPHLTAISHFSAHCTAVLLAMSLLAQQMHGLRCV